jgi:hypothetical protein
MLIAAAAALLGALPLIYAITSPRDRGGYNFNYSVSLIWAHWTGVAAVVLLSAAVWRILASWEARRRQGRPPSVPEPGSEEERERYEAGLAGAGRSPTAD